MRCTMYIAIVIALLVCCYCCILHVIFPQQGRTAMPIAGKLNDQSINQLDCLDLTVFYTMSSDHHSVVKKGKDCVAVAKNVLDDIVSGREKMAIKKLSALLKDGSFLAFAAKQLAERLEAVNQHYQNKDAGLLHQIGNLSRQESQLKSQKSAEEKELATQQTILSDNLKKLSSAKDSLQNAESKRKRAEKEEKGIKIGSTIGGAVLGLFTGGIGFIVCAVAGAGIGVVVVACRNKEKTARAVVNRCKSDQKKAHSAVNESKKRISSIESQIRSNAKEIEYKKKQRLQLHNKLDEIKAVIHLVKKSVEFWLLFKQISEQGVDRTELLRKIAARATEKGDYQALQSQSSKRISTTFIEVWEEIGTTVEQGELNHILEIDYSCSRCGVQCTALPYVDSSTLVCMECHSKYAQKKSIQLYLATYAGIRHSSRVIPKHHK